MSMHNTDEHGVTDNAVMNGGSASPAQTVASLIRKAGLLSAGCAVLMSCSTFQPDYTDCTSRLTAPDIGARADLVSEAGFAGIHARLNGVTAQCYQKGDDIIAEVSAGLKLTRDLTVTYDSDRVEVPFLAATLDADDKVTGYESFGFLLGWSNNVAQRYPVVDFTLRLPSDGRAVITLTPEPVRLEQ